MQPTPFSSAIPIRDILHSSLTQHRLLVIVCQSYWCLQVGRCSIIQILLSFLFFHVPHAVSLNVDVIWVHWSPSKFPSLYAWVLIIRVVIMLGVSLGVFKATGFIWDYRCRHPCTFWKRLVSNDVDKMSCSLRFSFLIFALWYSR